MKKLILTGFLLLIGTLGIPPDARAGHASAVVAMADQADPPPPSPDKDAPPPKEVKIPDR